MQRNGKSRISHDKITLRKLIIISISVISILSILVMFIDFLSFNTFPQDYTRSF